MQIVVVVIHFFDVFVPDVFLHGCDHCRHLVVSEMSDELLFSLSHDVAL